MAIRPSLRFRGGELRHLKPVRVPSRRGFADKMTAKMKIQINGQDRDCSAPLSLAVLLVELGMKTDRVAVELNQKIVAREQWASTTLQEGDRLEIVHFVGGGTMR
jgi:sulfur carrier protein